jgi:hypothetical protein
MPISEEERRRIIDLHFKQGKKIREVCKIMGKSSHDITPVTKEHRIQLAQNYVLANGERSDGIQSEQDRVIPNVKAYKLFDEGTSPLEVVAELNLPGPQVQQYYIEFLNMKRMYKLVTIYQENQDSMGYFLKLTRLGKEQGVTPKQIMKLIQMADSIHMLEDKLQQLQSEISDISTRKSEGQEELKNLHKEISDTQEKLDLVKKTFDIKYEELKEVCSQLQKLQNYVERFKDGQDYQELESFIRKEVGKSLLNNRKLLQNALFSVLLALRNDPNRYFIVDSIGLTYFANTIINYDSFSALRRQSNSQENEQLSDRVLEVARKVLSNLQKSIVDSTISAAAGLEGSSYRAAHQALPYYESQSQLSKRTEII